MVGSNNLLFYAWWIIIVVIMTPVCLTGNGSGHFQLVLAVIYVTVDEDLETVGDVSGFVTNL